jgi:AraC-like DNA-binding protein
MRTRHTKVESGADLMFRAAQRARTRPPLMAWLLARFQVQQGWSEPQLAAHLGLPPDELPRLALCLRPRPDHFADDVAALAAQVGCSPRALADLVRRTTADEHLKS